MNLTKLDTEQATVLGTNLAIEKRTTGEIYLSDKKYLDKLFKEIGFKNLNVIKILEEYAGKIVSDIGELTLSSLYLDEDKSEFIVSSSTAVDLIEDLIKTINAAEDIELVGKNYTEYHMWDEYFIKTKTNSFVMYVNLLKEQIQLYAVQYDGDCITGISDEGLYNISEIGTVDIIGALNANINLDGYFNLDATISYEEYAGFLASIGNLLKKRKKYVLIDELDENPEIEEFLYKYNSFSWLRRHIEKSGYTLKDLGKQAYLSGAKISDIFWIYESVMKETSDMYALLS